MNKQPDRSVRIAIDLGAESGRVLLVWLDAADGSPGWQEVHRFSNRILTLPGGLHWNISGIWQEILDGLRAAARQAASGDLQIRSVGVDCWGVDWCLLDEHGELLGLPHAYRDPRNEDSFVQVSSELPPRELYRLTGIQVMQINSLFSLRAMATASPQLMRAARRLLFLPDLIHYWLSGRQINEATIASTGQLMEADTGHWSGQLLQIAGLSPGCVTDPLPPATVLGPLQSAVAEATELPAGVEVILPASHDTASAIAAVPADPETEWCFISSGTWSLLGAEIPRPCLNDQAARYMFTNERGVAGTVRFLKNIAGLWLIQQCRRDFAIRDPGQQFDYEQLTELAHRAEPFRTLLDPDNPAFGRPGHFLEKIDTWATESGQPLPQTPGDYLRCCLESLAIKYRLTLDRLERVLDRRFEVIHVVGGGSNNRLLCQMTADATGRTVVAGPAEATAIGNGLVQAIGDGQIRDLTELRAIVRQSGTAAVYQPRADESWGRQAERLSALA